MYQYMNFLPPLSSTSSSSSSSSSSSTDAFLSENKLLMSSGVITFFLFFLGLKTNNRKLIMSKNTKFVRLYGHELCAIMTKDKSFQLMIKSSRYYLYHCFKLSLLTKLSLVVLGFYCWVALLFQYHPWHHPRYKNKK